MGGQAIAAVFTALGDGVKAWAETTWSLVEAWLIAPVAAAITALQTVGDAFVAIGGLMVGGMTAGIGAAALAIRDAVWAAKDAAILGLGTVTDWMAQVGRDIISGIWEGMLSMKDWFTEKLGGVKGWVTSGLGDLVGHSPSPFGIQLGKDLLEGFAVGLADSAGLAAVSQALGGVVSTVGSAGLASAVGTVSSGNAAAGTLGGWLKWDSQSYRMQINPGQVGSLPPEVVPTQPGVAGTGYMVNGQYYTAAAAADYLSATYGDLPKYSQGTPWVPETGYALLHRGEAVIPASANRQGGGIVVNITMPNYMGEKQEVVRQIVTEMRRAGLTI